MNAIRSSLLSFCLVLAACGGADAPPPPETGSPPPVLAVPPTITQQPVPVSVTAGQPASFTVAATGTAPLAYQWQRNGVDIAGANATTYAIAATVLGDSGAAFRAVVSNVAGSATSNAAVLTVTASAPVLTIAPQPANASVVAGANASFTVGGTCSSGTLAIQWQRNTGAGGAFQNLAGATAPTYTVATVIADNGAMFRAVLDCSGQSSAPSSAATLTVTAPGTVTLSDLNIVGLRAQAEIFIVAGIDQEASGSYAFITSNQVKRLSADLGTVTTLAGTPLVSGSTDGAGSAALFRAPLGVAHDAAGVLYVTDTGNHTIRRIAVDGTVTTLAGQVGVQGAADGTGAAATFSSPTGIVMAPDGDLYVADRGNNQIRRVTTAGVVTRYAGSTAGLVEGVALTAQFSAPDSVAVAANGDLLVGDPGNSRIRRVLRAGNAAGLVETLAGSANAAGNPDGIGVAATILPRALVVRGNVLTVRDAFGLMRQVDLTTRAVTTLTGSRILGAGYADGSTTTARMGTAGGVATAPNGGFLIADTDRRALRTVSATGDVRTIVSGFAQSMSPTGMGTLAQMPFSPTSSPAELLRGVTVAPAGNVVIVERQTGLVRRIDPSGNVTLVAGLTGGGFFGAPDGTGSEAQFAFNFYSMITSDSTGVIYLGDEFGVRRIGLDNATTFLTGSRTTAGGVDGNAATARLDVVTGLAVKPGGDVYFTDYNGAVRRIDATGTVTTYAGVMGQKSVVDGPIATARFLSPGQIAFLPDGSLFVVDKTDAVLRKIAADGSSVSTVALPAGSQVRSAIVTDSAGTLYYFDDSRGLMVLPLGGTPAVVVPSGLLNLGNAPSLPSVQSMALLGSKQIVLLSSERTLKVVLP